MRYQVTTTLTPREALEQALADFGPGGLGLQITSQTNLSLGFQGGGGYIAVSAQPGAKTIVEGDARVGCGSAGIGPATASLVAALVASQAARHVSASIIQYPR